MVGLRLPALPTTEKPRLSRVGGVEAARPGSGDSISFSAGRDSRVPVARPVSAGRGTFAA